MKRFAVLLIALASIGTAAFGQSQSVNQINGPAPNSPVYLYFYSGTAVTYICYAAAQQRSTVFTIGATPALTNIVVTSNSGVITFGATAQLWVGQQITTSGFATSAVNGTFKVTAVSGSTATISVTVADGTYDTSGAKLSTTGPVLDANVWNIQAFSYVSSLLTTSYYAGGGIGPNNQLACSNRANY